MPAVADVAVWDDIGRPSGREALGLELRPDMILVWGVVHAAPEVGGGLMRQLQDAALGWANEALFSEPWPVVNQWNTYYTHTRQCDTGA